MPSRHKQTAPPGNDPELAPLDAVRRHADALLRAAMECCRQHDRLARLQQEGSVELEEDAVHRLCETCDGMLGELARAYEQAAAHVRPDGEPAWWRRANAMWLASREYSRRHAGCDAGTRRLNRHRASDLASLHAEFELEGSALLALRHACDAYRSALPDVS
jgi:hypothetical protein